MNGYQTIDLGGINVTADTALQFSNTKLYPILERATKPIVIGNLSYKGVKQKPQYGWAVKDGENFKLELITLDDKVIHFTIGKDNIVHTLVNTSK